MPQDNRMTDPRVGMSPQRPDIPMREMTGAALTAEELRSNLGGEMARENIPSNMDMGMDSMMPQMQMDREALLEIDFLMKRFNLTMDQAVEAVAMTRDTGVRPEEFGGQQMPQRQPMPMQRPQTMGGQPMGGQQMPQQLGALPQMPPQAPPQRPFDVSGMSREQMDMLRRGIDPFAEGMVR